MSINHKSGTADSSLFLSEFDPLSVQNNHIFLTEPKKINRPKLDEERLLQPDALPFLISEGRTIKFKKQKNCEEENLDTLMGTYKLWANRIYPHFHFDRFVERTMRITRSKRMRSQLDHWIRQDHERLPNDATAPLVSYESPLPDINNLDKDERTESVLTQLGDLSDQIKALDCSTTDENMAMTQNRSVLNTFSQPNTTFLRNVSTNFLEPDGHNHVREPLLEDTRVFDNLDFGTIFSDDNIEDASTLDIHGL